MPEPTIVESFEPDRTVMTLPLVEEVKNRPQKPAVKVGKITETKEQEILAMIGAEGPLGKMKISEQLGLGASRTKDVLSGMVAKGLIVPEGAGRARVYRLLEDDEE